MITEAISSITLPINQQHVDLLKKKLIQFRGRCETIERQRMGDGHDPLMFIRNNDEGYVRNFFGWQILKDLLEKGCVDYNDNAQMQELFGTLWQEETPEADKRFRDTWNNIERYLDPIEGMRLLNIRLQN